MKRPKTWIIEAGVVALVLGIAAGVAGGKPVEWVGALAVLLNFMYAQVSSRLSEAEDVRERLRREAQALSQRYEHAANRPPLEEVQAADQRYLIHVECYRWLQRYFIGKELCWLVYFVWLGAWSALVGVFIFMLYPLWRRYHLRPRPTDQKPT